MMPSMLEHVVEQIGMVVVKYINGIRSDLKIADITHIYEANLSDLNKTSKFFDDNIKDVCSKSPTKAGNRRQHLEYLSSAYLFFRKKLDPLAPFGPVEQRNFQILFEYFLSSAFKLISSLGQNTVYQITDNLVLQLDVKAIKDQSKADDLIFTTALAEDPLIIQSKAFTTLESCRYQQGTLHHIASYATMHGILGTLGTHIKDTIFVEPIKQPDQVPFLTQAIELTTAHCLCINRSDRAESLAMRQELVSLKDQLQELTLFAKSLQTHVTQLETEIKSLKQSNHRAIVGTRPMFGFSMFPAATVDCANAVQRQDPDSNHDVNTLFEIA